MKNSKDISLRGVIGIIVCISLAMTLALISGCNVGGANIRLEDMSLGTITRDGKAVEGLPSEKVDLLLEVSTQEISVACSADGTVLTLSPSGATLEIKANSISINGLKPEQIKIEWTVSGQD